MQNESKINNNGFEYVDLKLPSGTLWAAMNVGASKASDAGLYFQWGDTVGYTANQVGKDKQFASDWSDYKWGKNPNFTKYTETGATLDLEDDAAHVNMGGEWHMPSPTQIQELIDNTTSAWTTQDGVNGRLFTSKIDPSKFIFIPAAGNAWVGSVQGSGDNGYFWSSMLRTDYVFYGQSLYFSSRGVGLGDYCCRYYGRSVRGVVDKKSDKPKENGNDMNENLNLIEILKNVPNGTKLWSSICGDCIFDRIDTKRQNPICCVAKSDNALLNFTSEGKFFGYYSDSECILFPSKENRDWSTFKVTKTHKHFKPYQKVLIKDWFGSKSLLLETLYGHYIL